MVARAGSAFAWSEVDDVVGVEGDDRVGYGELRDG